MFGRGKSTLNNLITAQNYELAASQCQAKPHQAKVWSTRAGFFDGREDARVLPIHQVCARNPTTAIVEVLAEAHPDGLNQPESAFRRLPLHIACRTGASTEVIRALLRYFPEGARAQDSMGRTPLHYALANGATLEAVESLVSVCPQACQSQDLKGWVPLHVVCSMSDSSLEKVRAVLDSYPDAVFSRTKAGSTPMKLIGNCGSESEAIKTLLSDEIINHTGSLNYTAVAA